MRLAIEHTTTYRYERLVTFGRHRLVLRPREGHDLRVERMALQIAPDHHVQWIRDVFGNSIALVDFVESSSVLTIVNAVTVERLAPFPQRAFHEPWRVAFPPVYDPLEIPVTQIYQMPAFPDDGAEVRGWLGSAVTSDPQDAEGAMQALCDRIFKNVAYQQRSEKGVQSPAQTLQLRTGSCRDLATLMMEAARYLGVASRFASGYHHAPSSVAGRGTTHAWTEVYLPTLGWRGFDPTLGAPVSLHHVVTGVSNHPRGVMPVTGAFSGTRADVKALEVTVQTREL